MPPTPRTRPGRALLSWTLPAAVVFAALAPASRRPEPDPQKPSVLLITLDTTRADHVGKREGQASLTPNLDSLERRGTRYVNAVTVAPLTLPAHCSLLTGLTPAAHGVRDNGVAVLSAQSPTLATALAARGYATGAFVSSRVLDRRFGLDRGFGTYDDQMVAESIGEHGYPERDARAVTTAALAWAARQPPGRPYFLWIHYYDPHSPYQPPGDWKDQTPARRYAGEVAFMDSEVGRLLRELPKSAGGCLIAAVGDHGEMLGEHDEKEHGIFLYGGSLAVPLILAGPRVPAGRQVRELVGTRALAATLLALANLSEEARAFGPALPGVGVAAAASPQAVYSETYLPANTYGWSPLRAATDGRWRFIAAPRPELYDLVKDPTESRNLASELPQESARLQRVVEQAESGARPTVSADPDPELAASLRSLGYLSGASPQRADGLDPKDGIRLLKEFEEARELSRAGRSSEAILKLESLVRRSPGNVPFLMRLGDAQLAGGMAEEGLKALTYAVTLSPRLDFLHVRLAQACAELGQVGPARNEYALALKLNPRSAPAWSGLAEIARTTGGPLEERKVLQECEAAGTRSATLLRRLSEIEAALGDRAAAQRHAAEADRLTVERGGDAAAEKGSAHRPETLR
ncbi:MAG: sulfatase-like hydrolase/transferase [Acidobacteriota bacterium]